MHKDVIVVGAGISGIAAGYNLKKVGYQKVFNLMGFQDILDQGAKKQSLI